jgi:hypothetical protein
MPVPQIYIGNTLYYFVHRIWDRSFGVATRLLAGQPGFFDFRRGQEIFVFSIAFRPALGSTQLPVLWVPGV